MIGQIPKGSLRDDFMLLSTSHSDPDLSGEGSPSLGKGKHLMIGQTISHYKILEKLGEARLRPVLRDFVGQVGPTTLQEMELRRSSLFAGVQRTQADLSAETYTIGSAES
jgi:hypothetical protein